MGKRQEIVEVGKELVQTRSYFGFSFQDIAERVNIRKPSLYHHFKSKEELAITVLDTFREEFQPWAAKQAELLPMQRIVSWVELYGNHLGAGKKVCPAGSFVPGWGGLPQGVQKHVKSLMKIHLDYLEAAVKDGIESGELRDDAGTAKDVAGLILSAAHGSLTMARITGKKTDFSRYSNALIEMIAARS